ncbi:ADAMTS-like protein 3 [Hippopotamus amphibius kiboko]|uniref:ADAMTS-like protein 3 n=1 Tax=Hippopotamus amphibius kiboko TaxID=575201 RepID=UPI00259861FA|nr:ADAMTS-like protein 3 [Hippopotamus amphibius kiboko]
MNIQSMTRALNSLNSTPSYRAPPACPADSEELPERRSSDHDLTFSVMVSAQIEHDRNGEEQTSSSVWEVRGGFPGGVNRPMKVRRQEHSSMKSMSEGSWQARAGLLQDSGLATGIDNTVAFYHGGVMNKSMHLQCLKVSHCVPQPNVTWLKKGGSLSDNISLLFNGSLLLQNVSLENEGTYVCTATNALGKAMAASILHLLETFWELGNWTHCSATCGHLGARVQRPQCLMANGQEVSEAFCDHLQKPLVGFQPCNIQDCPSRWFTGAWSECSVSCGEGFCSRQVTCQRTRANGTVQVTPPRACAPKDRPLGRRPCSSHACVQGLTEPRNQVMLTHLLF